MATISAPAAEALREAASSVNDAYAALRSALGDFNSASDVARGELVALVPGQYPHPAPGNFLNNAMAIGAAIDFVATVEVAWNGYLPAPEGE